MTEFLLLILAGNWLGARQRDDPDDEIMLAVLVFPLVALVALPWLLWAAFRDHGATRVTAACYSLLVLLATVSAGYLLGWPYGVGGWFLATLAGFAGIAHAGYVHRKTEESAGEGVPSWRFS